MPAAARPGPDIAALTHSPGIDSMDRADAVVTDTVGRSRESGGGTIDDEARARQRLEDRRERLVGE